MTQGYYSFETNSITISETPKETFQITPSHTMNNQDASFYFILPEDIANRQVFVVDPMLATGGSAVAAIDFLKKHGCRNIIMMNIIGAPEGVKAVQEAHPDVEIYLAALDEKLNEHAYIVPGLGDAGDRIFGTK